MGVKKWSWLVFPILVTITVLFSSRWLVAGPDQIWRKLRLTGREVKTAEVEVVKLKNKLDVLNGVDMARQKEILAKLETAVPRREQVEVLIGEVLQAAFESGAAVESYRAAGSGLGVTLQAGDPGLLKSWVDNMERRLPLVKIVNINYVEGRAEVTVEQVWKETVISGAGPADELPETGEQAKNILSKLGEFREVGTSSGQTKDDGAVNPNPF